MNDRQSTLALAALLAAVGLAGAWLVATDIDTLATALRTGAPRIVVDSGAATAAPGVLAIGLLLAMLIGRPSGRGRTTLFGTVLVCVALMFIAPPIFRATLGNHLAQAGYAPCDRPVTGNRRALPWVKPGAACHDDGST